MAPKWIALPGVDASALQPGQHLSVTGRTGRKLLLLRTHAGDLSCLDAACFHQGADLSQGELVDIESLGTVVRCPRHGRCVDAKTGEWVEPPTWDAQQLALTHHAQWCRVQHVQRIHRVRVCPSTGLVEAELDDDQGRLPSDLYNVRREGAQPGLAAASSGTIAFASRKRSATDAVKERLRQKPIALASPSLASTSVLRQPQIGDFFGTSPSRPPADAMPMDMD